ncbi:MAG: mechanosensitive ion channel family protein [Nanoarchaeota archaeon]|nr:mechanosensitive ion channel family protein [Nanoarchaeota archaeon]
MAGYVNFFSNTKYGDLISWAILILAVIIGTKIIAWLIEKFIKNITKKTKTSLDDKLLDAFEKSLMVAAVITITYIAANDLPSLVARTDLVKKILFVITVFGAAFIIIHFLRALLSWYGEEISEKTDSEVDDIFIPILIKVSGLIVYLFGLIIVLTKFGISITPILASLGVASLAIALALKDTLAEFFSGFYIMADRPVKKGDLVRLDNGEEGVVEDIGWRTTRIKSATNSTIYVPNTKLATSMIQNFEAPMHKNFFTIKGGVSYESDLDQVEKILTKVAKEVIKDTEESVKDADPIVRFTNFGDSNIDFAVILKVHNYGQRHPMIHNFIKKTKKEFDKVGIDINYPARKIYYAPQPKRKKR